ncbi:putative response regulator receiver protein [Sphingobium sp. SYK-6]|uniref:response regulator n=1 Tax=Sphingobium sp. (strain NBRC 103272 / SYK-6) TaxID=627192 RepID=UPI00022768FA|nr:response regulator [Sphingobium sp. SYK-6]BAK64696.1 putative response regulator receiver protein [Sphingobium sp. SYK-6]
MTMRGLAILIIEDEPILALALEDMLEKAGASPILADTLAEATEMIARQPPDAAILDVNVHGEQSYSVAAALAERRIPFIFATGYGDAMHEDAHAQVPTVAKPYSFRDIERALKRAQGM